MPTGTPGRTHGIPSTYTGGGCRCDACRLANSRYYHKQTMKERYAEPPPHGTESRYSKDRGCRCDACRTAASEARAERRRRARMSQVREDAAVSRSEDQPDRSSVSGQVGL